MYKNTDSINKTENKDFTGYVDGTDIFNSELLHRVNEITNFTKYRITRYAGRADLIAKEIYNANGYMWVILFVNRMRSEELTEGTVINFIPRNIIDSLINNL